MGCSCLKSNLVIKSKVPVTSNTINLENINNSSHLAHPSQNRNGTNDNTHLPQNISPQRNEDSQNNLSIQNNNPSNVAPRQVSSNNANNFEYMRREIGFNAFEPYLISKNDPNFNYPELPNEYMGHGLKRMKGYVSSITLEELNKVREDFWSSRIEGDMEIWELMRAVCSDKNLSDEDIEGMLMAGGVVPYRDCINVVYDSKGAIYEIPNYCINDPSQYDIPEIQYNKEKPQTAIIKFKLRYFADDFQMEMNNSTSILQLKEKFAASQENKKKYDPKQIRIFFGGKELKDDKELWFYDIGEGSIAQMLIREIEKNPEPKKEEEVIEKESKKEDDDKLTKKGTKMNEQEEKKERDNGNKNENNTHREEEKEKEKKEEIVVKEKDEKTSQVQLNKVDLPPQNTEAISQVEIEGIKKTLDSNNMKDENNNNNSIIHQKNS